MTEQETKDFFAKIERDKKALEAAEKSKEDLLLAYCNVKSIREAMDNLLAHMNNGFKRMTDRQDIANGKLLTNETDIHIIRTQISGNRFSERLLWFALSVMVGLTVYAVTVN